jgi:transcriptional regulator with XRE-family HTH domain
MAAKNADEKPWKNLKRFRLSLGKKGEKQYTFALDVGIPENTYKALELGYRRPTRRTADLIAERTGVNAAWLLKDEQTPIINSNGTPYQAKDFEEAQKRRPAGDAQNGYLRRLSRMEFAQAFFLLWMLDDEWGRVDSAPQLLHPLRHMPKKFRRNLPGHDRSAFQSRLQSFIQSEEIKLPVLHQQLQEYRDQWWKENVATGRMSPKSWLYPRDPEIFDLLIKELTECKLAFELHQQAIDESYEEIKAAKSAKKPKRPPL